MLESSSLLDHWSCRKAAASVRMLLSNVLPTQALVFQQDCKIEVQKLAISDVAFPSLANYRRDSRVLNS